jgi:hypothetical protein
VSLFFLAPSRRPLGNSECGPSPAASKTIRRPLPDRERQLIGPPLLIFESFFVSSRPESSEWRDPGFRPRAPALPLKRENCSDGVLPTSTCPRRGRRDSYRDGRGSTAAHPDAYSCTKTKALVLLASPQLGCREATRSEASAALAICGA